MICQRCVFTSLSLSLPVSLVAARHISSFQPLRTSFRPSLTDVPAVARDIPDYVEKHDALFLQKVEATVSNVLSQYSGDISIHDVPPRERESLGVARNLNERIQAFRRNNNCPRCWLQRVHCICNDSPPLPDLPAVGNIYLLCHHKEICMIVDTAKLIMAAYPEKTTLVVGGIGPEFQDSMRDFLGALQKSESCLVLFPSDDASTAECIYNERSDKEAGAGAVDLVVLDGTWEQARRLYKRYIPENGPRRIQLSTRALDTLSAASKDSGFTGRQLRRHPELFREISTLAAFHLLLQDIDQTGDQNCLESRSKAWDSLTDYQERADMAACVQLGELRAKQT